MPPKRGRPSSIPPPASPFANPFQSLYPPDKTQVECYLCRGVLVPSIPLHLVQVHPTVRIDEYREMFKAAPLEGVVDLEKEPSRAVVVTQDEAAAHPGGREAALIEKTLDERERSAYHADILSLLEQGHAPSHQVASLGYLMTLSRRTRLTIEMTRNVTKGEIFNGDALERFYDIEARIGKAVADLEKIRTQRVEEAGEDPLSVVQEELDGAEAFVQAHIGEYMHRCPNPACGTMLAVPALPHWAFEPLKTDHGTLWPVWSAEMWKLVLSGEMRLSTMSYCLRTSPEGLKYTASRRNEPWPDDLVIEEAEAELRVRLLADERVIKALPVAVGREGEIVHASL